MRKAGLLRLAVLGLAGVLGIEGTARADTIVNFTFVDFDGFSRCATCPSALTGTVNIDTTTGQFGTIQATGYSSLVSSALTFEGTPGFAYGGNDGFYVSDYNPNIYEVTRSPNGPIRTYGGYATLQLVPLGSLVGFTGGPLLNGPSNDYLSTGISVPSGSTTGTQYVDYYYSGSLVPTASLSAVPEPSTWVLTGTALLGGLGLLSRRRAAVRTAGV